MKYLQLTATWPEDFFSVLVRKMPSEFKDSKSAQMRGTYEHKVVMQCYKVVLPKFPTADVFDFKVIKHVSSEDGGLRDFLEDIRKIARTEKLTEAKTPADLKAKTFLLSLTTTAIRLLIVK